MTAVEKVNNSAVLGALAKVGMVLAPIVVSIGLFVIGTWLDNYGKAQAAFNARLVLAEQSTISLDKRTSIVESRAETQSKDIDEVAGQVEDVAQTVQAMSLDVATTKTDVGYLRRAEEERRAKTR